MIDNPIGLQLNDPRIELVEQYFPATVETYALYADNEKRNLGAGYSRDRIHFWAKVRLVSGGTAFVGITLSGLHTGIHAEQDNPYEYFVEYSDDPNS